MTAYWRRLYVEPMDCGRTDAKGGEGMREIQGDLAAAEASLGPLRAVRGQRRWRRKPGEKRR